MVAVAPFSTSIACPWVASHVKPFKSIVIDLLSTTVTSSAPLTTSISTVIVSSVASSTIF